MHLLSPKSLLQKKQPSKKVVTHSKVQDRFRKNRKQDAMWNEAASDGICLGHCQLARQSGHKWKDKRMQKEEHNTCGGTSWWHLRLQQLLLHTNSLFICCPKYTSFWLFSPPLIVNMLGIKKKELNLHQ